MTNQEKIAKQAAERIGMRKQNNDGEWMTITEYFDSHNITVRFDDGAIVLNRIYGDFKKGAIKHPDFYLRRIGEEKIANNGQKMKITDVFGRDNITIQFEDGTIVTNKWYRDFQKGEIENPNYHVKVNMPLHEFVFEYYLEKYGFKKTRLKDIEEFKDCQDESIKRMEFDLYNDEYKIAIEFDGNLHSKAEQIERDLKKNKLCKEHGITIIRLRHKCKTLNDSSIDFVFENGRCCIDSNNFDEIVKEICHYINSIADLSINISFSVRDDYEDIRMKHIEKYKENRIGEKRMMNNGLEATITAYLNSKDIDLEFEDGMVVTHRTYSNFKKGNIGHPFINAWKKRNLAFV